MQRGRRLAFDYGQTRIGVAICDPDAIISSPLTVLKSSDPDLQSQLRTLIEEHEAIALYVGLPRHLSGDEGASSAKAREFANFLSTICSTPVTLIDERLSTVSAQEKLRQAGISTRESKKLIDAMAAVEILDLAIANERARG